jgi:hypothetical protein
VSDDPPAVVADASALLAIVSALPLEPPEVRSLLAPDSALTDVVAVLRSFHEGRVQDVLGDLAAIGVHVDRWLPTFRFATSVAELALEHPEQIVGDLVAVAAARELELPLLTGQPDLAGLAPDTMLLDRRPA